MEIETWAREAAERGAVVLDEKTGDTDWPTRVDLDSLNQASAFHCVLGQLFVYFTDGVDELWPDAPDYPYCCEACNGSRADYGSSRSELAAAAGFVVADSCDDWAPHYEALTRAWRTLIEARRAPTTAPEQEGPQ